MVTRKLDVGFTLFEKITGLYSIYIFHVIKYHITKNRIFKLFYLAFYFIKIFDLTCVDCFKKRRILQIKITFIYCLIQPYFITYYDVYSISILVLVIFTSYFPTAFTDTRPA